MIATAGGASSHLRLIWRQRHLCTSLIAFDLRRRYRGSMLGVGWSLLHPIAMTVVICAVFGPVFDVDVREYAPFLLTGLALWNFVSTMVNEGSTCFQAAEPYIRQYPSPIAIYPIRVCGGAIVHLLFALAVALVCTWALQGFGNLSALWMLPPTLLLVAVFGVCIAAIIGLFNTLFHDVQHVAQVGLQLFFYVTPIMYSPDMLKGRATLSWLPVVNPIAGFLDILRTSLVDGGTPEVGSVVCVLSATAVLLAAAFPLLLRWQTKLVFHL